MNLHLVSQGHIQRNSWSTEYLYKFPLKPEHGCITAGTFGTEEMYCQTLPNTASSSENSMRQRRK